MSDDLRERVARAIAESQEHDWGKLYPNEKEDFKHDADAALAEIGAVRVSEPAPVSVQHEGPDVKLARDAYSMGNRDGLEGIRVSDLRVILSRLRAIAEGKDDD